MKCVDESTRLQSEGPRRESPEDSQRYSQQRMSSLKVQHQKGQHCLIIVLVKWEFSCPFIFSPCSFKWVEHRSEVAVGKWGRKNLVQKMLTRPRAPNMRERLAAGPGSGRGLWKGEVFLLNED